MIQFPQTKHTKDAIRNVIGRPVTFIIQGEPSACPVCSGADLYDSVNELSINQFCPTCSGAYWFTADSGINLVGHVRHRTGDEEDWGIAGSVITGDCTITIGIDDLSEDKIVKIKEIRTDGRRFRVFRAIKRGVQERDRIRFLCRLIGEE